MNPSKKQSIQSGEKNRNRLTILSRRLLTPWKTDAVQDLIFNLGYRWNDNPNQVNLLGIRAFLAGKVVENRFNEYNDSILVSVNPPFRRDGAVFAFQASVDPGKVDHPNPKGVAHLADGQYLYRLGKHRGREPALVQDEPVKVIRYMDDSKETSSQIFEETGWFGIQIHRGGNGPTVGNWSAGCQVVRGKQWPLFLHLINQARIRGQRRFPYTLVNHFF